MKFPLSPANSFCDSLDGIEDLDAYLAIQGPISSFPTPPIDKELTIARDAAANEDEDTKDWVRVATLFANQAAVLIGACIEVPTIRIGKTHIQDVIDFARKRTSREVWAVAYNILSTLQAQGYQTQVYTPDLLILCAILLASDFLEDRPVSIKRWDLATSITSGMSNWLDVSMEYMKLNMLFAIDWQLHSLSSPQRVEHTLSLFLGDVEQDVCAR